MIERIIVESPDGVAFRGHHFGALIHAEYYGSSEAVNSLTARMQANRGNYTSNDLNVPRLASIGHDHPLYDAAYAIDLIGDTRKQTNEFRRRNRIAFSRLDSTHPLTPVTFHTKPDAICDSCIFGNHCARPDVRTADILAIDTLGWVSEGLQMKDQVEISGSKEDGSYKLVTSLKAARVMMGLFVYANPQDPAKAFALSYNTPTYEPFAAANANGGRYPAYNRPWDPQYYGIPDTTWRR